MGAEDDGYYKDKPAPGAHSYVDLQVRSNLWDIPVTKAEVAAAGRTGHVVERAFLDEFNRIATVGTADVH